MREAEIKELLQLKTELNQLKIQKEDDLSRLQSEIDHIISIINNISKMISNDSFKTAKSMYEADMDAETAASKKPKYSNNISNTRKLFSPITSDLISVLKFQKDQVFIRFPNPEKTQITQEKYITFFVKPVLLKLKKIENNLTPSISKSIYGELEYIDSITLKNISNFESFEFIVEKMEDFLSTME